MGMFDTVEVHRKLPLKANDEVTSKDITALKKNISWKDIEFQTKALDNCMEHFKIAVNGKLYVQRQKYKEVDSKKHHSKKNKNLFNVLPLLEPDGKPWFEPAPKIPTSLQFYTTVKLSEGEEYWVEFEAIFLEGKLHQIKQIALELLQDKESEAELVSEEPLVPQSKNLIVKFFKRLLGCKR